VERSLVDLSILPAIADSCGYGTTIKSTQDCETENYEQVHVVQEQTIWFKEANQDLKDFI